MTRWKLTALSLALLAAGSIGFMPAVCADAPKESDLLRVGMAKTFFNDVPSILISIVTEPFGELMKKTTGLNGQLNPSYKPFEVAQKLQDNQLQLGVFHGHEYAWVQQKYPDLRPLMVVVNKLHDVRAFLIVNKKCTAKTIAELRGKKLALPVGTKEHCRAYLEKNCADNALTDPKSFFSAIVKSASAEAALDDVCRGKVDAAMVDTLALEFYKEIKGPCFDNNLKVLLQSEQFPPAVIAYKQGVIDQATLMQFRAGLLTAHDTDLGRDMMKMWKIEAFEMIPANFDRNLAETLKAYPAPEATKISRR